MGRNIFTGPKKGERPVFMHLYMPSKPVPQLIFGYYSVVTRDMWVFYGDYGLTAVRVL